MSLKDAEGAGDVPPVDPTEETIFSSFVPYRVFLNQVDTFKSKYISSYLTDQVYGVIKFLPPSGAEEEVAEGPPPEPQLQNLPKDKYEVIGTLSSAYRKPTEDILYILNENDEKFNEEVLNCGFIIYDITKFPHEIEKALKTLTVITEQLEELKKIGPKTYENFNETKVFILISTVMTWALTKPLDPDDPDLPFSEIDYRKRRPHPNYKDHYNCEKEVIKIGQKYKEKLKTYIVCTGVTYGEEEDILDFFFRKAWYNEILPIFEKGNNKIPFIHVKDLAKALHGLMEIAPSKPQYILAVEQTPSTLKQFVKNLSRFLGDGKVKCMVAEEAILQNNMTQTIFDRCNVNLNMEPVFLVENLQLQWENDLNIAENMSQIVNEYKTKLNLRPVKIIIHGPPASGKTHLANRLCEYYNCKYVSIETMLNDLIQIWVDEIREEKLPKDPEYLGEEEVEEEEDEVEEIKEQLKELQLYMENGIANIPDDYLIGLLRKYLAKNFCQNRGYVLDGFPQITDQAKELFAKMEAEGGEEEDEQEQTGDSQKILPDLIVSLLASDEFITQRIMKMSEEEIRGTPNAEEIILNRLEAFRENNTDDNTILNYFDELEIDIILLDVEISDHDNFTQIINKLGLPCSFGLTPEELEELYRLEEEEKRLALEKAELEEQLQLEKAEEEKKNRMESWSETLEQLQKEEEKIIIAQSEPLRHYLMKYIFPTLTKGLIELATLKPDDPVDFLAEYLFKENPEGRMFDPAYNAEGEHLYTEFRGYIEKVIAENEAFEK